MLPLEMTDIATDQIQAPQSMSALRVLADGALSIGFVTAVYRVGRRAVMGYYLPDDTNDIDLHRTTTDRDRNAMAVMTVAYITGVGLTATAVSLLASLAWALAWAGVLALVAAVVALAAAKDASPVDDIRMLVEARRGRVDDGAVSEAADD